MKKEQRKYGCIIMISSLFALIYSLSKALDYSVSAYSNRESYYFNLSDPGIAAVIVSSVFLLFGLIVFIKGLLNDNSDK